MPYVFKAQQAEHVWDYYGHHRIVHDSLNKHTLKKSQLVSLEFFIDIKSFRSHYGPGPDSVSSRDEYQEYFLGVKADGLGMWRVWVRRGGCIGSC